MYVEKVALLAWASNLPNTMRTFYTVASALVALAHALSAGCASAPAAMRPRTRVAASVTYTTQAPTPAPRHAGPLTRADVEALLAEGLGAFLARIEVSPVIERQRFVGFRLDAAQDLEVWRAAGADIRVGDVIQRVNGIRIERPEQALWAFERLRIVDAVEVQLRRAGVLLTIRHPILDAAPSAARE